MGLISVMASMMQTGWSRANTHIGLNPSLGPCYVGLPLCVISMSLNHILEKKLSRPNRTVAANHILFGDQTEKDSTLLDHMAWSTYVIIPMLPSVIM